ncbi:MAG: hemolysin activating-like protein [Paucimonas sp.]|nr:hemolysin activating-like protein [Paucimonas sp.]
MHPSQLDIIAPGMTARTWNEAEVVGAAVWLWMQSPAHQGLALQALSARLLAPIKRRQFMLGSNAGQPLFFLCWARFSVAAEARFLETGPVGMPEADWDSGDRLWIVDWVAPFGHTNLLARLVRRHLFRRQAGRMLYHRSQERGRLVKTFRGKLLRREDARLWFETHPLPCPGKPGFPQAD